MPQRRNRSKNPFKALQRKMAGGRHGLQRRQAGLGEAAHRSGPVAPISETPVLDALGASASEDVSESISFSSSDSSSSSDQDGTSLGYVLASDLLEDDDTRWYAENGFGQAARDDLSSSEDDDFSSSSEEDDEGLLFSSSEEEDGARFGSSSADEVRSVFEQEDDPYSRVADHWEDSDLISSSESSAGGQDFLSPDQLRPGLRTGLGGFHSPFASTADISRALGPEKKAKKKKFGLFGKKSDRMAAEPEVDQDLDLKREARFRASDEGLDRNASGVDGWASVDMLETGRTHDAEHRIDYSQSEQYAIELQDGAFVWARSNTKKNRKKKPVEAGDLTGLNWSEVANQNNNYYALNVAALRRQGMGAADARLAAVDMIRARPRLIFVMTASGEFFAGTGEVGVVHHSSLSGGGAVAGAGEMGFSGSVPNYLNNYSGHYRPGPFNMWQVVKELDSKGVAAGSVEVELHGVSDRFQGDWLLDNFDLQAQADALDYLPTDTSAACERLNARLTLDDHEFAMQVAAENRRALPPPAADEESSSSSVRSEDLPETVQFNGYTVAVEDLD